MKKGMSLTVFLMFCSSLDVHTQQFQTLEPSEQCAVIHENLKRNSYFDAPFNQLYERGKRGKRGKRGPRGKRGRSVSSSNCGLNEVLINAPMMCWFGQAILPDALVTPYNNGSAGNTDIPTWTLYASTDFPYNPFVGANFNVPVDLDTTKPVTAVIHMLVDSSDETGDQAKLQVQMDYQPNDGLLGSVVPATGFADTEVSADFTVLPATPSLSANMRHVSVSIPLDITKIVDNDWAFITVGRIAPAANEYSGILYLSTISIQYSRLCS